MVRNTRLIFTVLSVLLVVPAFAQYEKAYIKYFNTASHRNTEGDLIVKNNGAYYAVWTQFRRGWEDDAPADLAAKYSIDSGRNWIDLGVVLENIGVKTTASVSLLRIGHDTVHMYFLVKNSNADLKVYRKKSFDDCVTWTAPEIVINDAGYSIVLNAKVRRLGNGRIVMPIAASDNADVVPPNYFKCYIYYSDNNGDTWTQSTPELSLSQDLGYLEPAIFEAGGIVKMNMRVQSGGLQVFSNSNDNGATWGTPYTSTLSSTASPATIIRLSTGILIAIHNPVVSGVPHFRSVLRISRSVNEGVTWVQVFDLESNKANFNFSYSSAVEHDGRLLLTYWELNPTAGKYALKFAGIPLSKLNL